MHCVCRGKVPSSLAIVVVTGDPAGESAATAAGADGVVA